jgi:hypothetical protein
MISVWYKTGYYKGDMDAFQGGAIYHLESSDDW